MVIRPPQMAHAELKRGIPHECQTECYSSRSLPLVGSLMATQKKNSYPDHNSALLRAEKLASNRIVVLVSLRSIYVQLGQSCDRLLGVWKHTKHGASLMTGDWTHEKRMD